MKKVALGCGLLLVLCLVGIGISIAPRFVPDVLFLHPSGKQWSRITVTPPVDSHTTATSFRATDDLLKVAPIVYGPYLLRIEYADGRVVWATFWHADAGVRKRVDLYINRGPGGAEFRQVINQNETVFTGSVRPEQTSETKPFLLEGP